MLCNFHDRERALGGSLAHVIKRRRVSCGRADAATERAWAWSTRLALLCDVAEGVAQMHAKRYIHRDLKPDNVLIDGEGRAKIADMGLARSHSEFDVAKLASLELRRQPKAASANLTWADAGGTPQCPCASIPGPSCFSCSL